MKKPLYTLAALAALTLPAQAQDMTMKPYVGFDIQRYTIGYDDYNDGVVAFDYGDLLDDSLIGFNVHAGTRFHENFGAELGYFRTREGDKNLGAGLDSKIKLQGVTLDGLGYLPLTEQFDLIGTAGVSYTWAEAELDTGALGLGTLKADDKEFGLRLGGGAQYSFTDNISLRGIARYQSADFDSTAERMWIYSVGLNYSF